MTGCLCNTYNSIGQTPGQQYSGQVVDQTGNGLFAGFFYLDANGQQITIDYVTDKNGFFHFTIPDYNHNSIFIQFYATAEYTPIVKTFEEVVNNPKVVLSKKGNRISMEAFIGLAGLGVSIYALSRKKKVSGMDKQQKKNILLVAGGAAALYFIFRYKPTPQQRQFLDHAKSRLEELASNYGIVPSLTMSQFSTLAAQILRAVDKCGTDEAAIQRAFIALNNEADFWQLVVSFGIGKYDGCFEGNLPSWNVHYTLPEALASDLSALQIADLNQLLFDKGIDITI